MADRETGQPSPQPSGLVAGKYRLTRLLGRGGMGAVWEAVHDTLGTRVAVKLIEAEHVQSADSRRRFENEARAAAKLQSKHVVEVYDNGVGADGRPFIVMQYLQGEALDQRLSRVGRLTPADTVRIVQQVCRALSKAHSVGIVHRDLKPENIFLVWDEEDQSDIVKVVNFGIAKLSDDLSPENSATRTGSVVGTPFYMSPEQARGLRSVDHRSDFWSLAVIAFRCMVGRLPFEGEAVGDVLVNLCTGPIPVPSALAPDLPPGFDGWIRRALSRDPGDRFSTATELAESLAAACGVTVRIAYTTGDIPIRATGDGETIPVPAPVITPSYPSGKDGRPITGAPRLSHPDASTLVVPTGYTGTHTAGPTVNTPSPAPRHSVASIVAATVLATLILGAGVAALVQVLGKPNAGTASGASTTPTQGSEERAPAGATPTPTSTEKAAATNAGQVAQPEPTPLAAAPSAASSVDAGRPRATSRPNEGTRRPPPRASSTPGLDIRLER